MEFDIAGTHTVVVVHGKTHHLQPLLVGEKCFTFLEGVLWRDNIPYLIEVAMSQHGIANDKMPNVDGIERAKEETYLSHGDGGKGKSQGGVSGYSLSPTISAKAPLHK